MRNTNAGKYPRMSATLLEVVFLFGFFGSVWFLNVLFTIMAIKITFWFFNSFFFFFASEVL